jgi:elongator complex protein 6
LADKKQFAFVDGLSELFSAPQTANPALVVPSMMGGPARTSLPFRPQPGAVPGRGPLPAAAAAAAPALNNGDATRTPTQHGITKKLHLSGKGIAALDAVERDIASVIQQQKSSMEDGEELLLIIDQPDFLLAATGSAMEVGATAMAEWVSGLQQASPRVYEQTRHRLT